MAASNSNFSVQFLRCDDVVAAWEGRYVNDSRDPGGPTDRGITQATLDDWSDRHGLARRSVKGITREQAQRVFWDDYWLKAGCQKLDVGVDLAVYDASVNSGVSRGRKWLLASLGGTAPQTVNRICEKRLGFVQSLKHFTRFGKGWSRRIADIEAKGVAWALSAANTNTVVITRELQAASKAAQKKSVAQTRGAAGAAAGTGTAGGGAAVNPEIADQMGGLVLGGLLTAGVLVAGYFIIRAIINSQRATAYAREAGAVT